MSTMIQIRNVPDEVHRTLKSRAALAGQSLSDYILNHLDEVARRPTMEDMRARLETRSRSHLSVEPEVDLRAGRERDAL